MNKLNTPAPLESTTPLTDDTKKGYNWNAPKKSKKSKKKSKSSKMK